MNLQIRVYFYSHLIPTQDNYTAIDNSSLYFMKNKCKHICRHIQYPHSAGKLRLGYFIFSVKWNIGWDNVLSHRARTFRGSIKFYVDGIEYFIYISSSVNEKRMKLNSIIFLCTEIIIIIACYIQSIDLNAVVVRFCAEKNKSFISYLWIVQPDKLF